MTHERLNLPSASSFGIDAICPGRQALLNSLGPLPEVVDEDAQRGTNLHAAWQDAGTPNLHLFEDSEDTELYERGLKLVETAKGQWGTWLQSQVFANQPFKEGPREQRFWIRDSSGELAASGQADRHYIAGDFALCIDFKSLWCRSLTPSELNWQLLLLAVAIRDEYGVAHVRCAFVKPMFNSLDVVDYNSEDLDRASNAVQQVLWNSHHVLDRRAGPHCRHCKGTAACPEAKAYCLLPSAQSNALEGIKPKDATDIAQRLDLKDCVRIWETQTSRRNIEDAIKARLKTLPPEQMTQLGIELGKPKTNRTITNAEGAFDFLISVGISPEKLWQIMELSNGKLADLVSEELGKTQKAATEWIREKLKPFIIEHEQEKPLQKI